MIPCATSTSGTNIYQTHQNLQYLKSSREFKPMTRKFHRVSIEDREMFAYNRTYQQVQDDIKRINSHPEQCMKYCFEFLKGADDLMRVKCYDGIAKYSAQLDYSEAHF